MLKKLKQVILKRDTREDAGSLESRVVILAKRGKLAKAARNAVRAQRRKGLAVTFQRGTDIIKLHPDGREEVLGKVERPKYVLPRNVSIIKSR